MPRATRNRTLIAQARVSAPELAKWRAKVAASGVGLSELLRRAMARTRTWTAAAAKVERDPRQGLARGQKPPSIPRGNSMPRATRNRTLIAQARVSAPELAKVASRADPSLRQSPFRVLMVGWMRS